MAQHLDDSIGVLNHVPFLFDERFCVGEEYPRLSLVEEYLWNNYIESIDTTKSHSAQMLPGAIDCNCREIKDARTSTTYLNGQGSTSKLSRCNIPEASSQENRVHWLPKNKNVHQEFINLAYSVDRSTSSPHLTPFTSSNSSSERREARKLWNKPAVNPILLADCKCCMKRQVRNGLQDQDDCPCHFEPNTTKSNFNQDYASHNQNTSNSRPFQIVAGSSLDPRRTTSGADVIWRITFQPKSTVSDNPNETIIRINEKLSCTVEMPTLETESPKKMSVSPTIPDLKTPRNSKDVIARTVPNNPANPIAPKLLPARLTATRRVPSKAIVSNKPATVKSTATKIYPKAKNKNNISNDISSSNISKSRKKTETQEDSFKKPKLINKIDIPAAPIRRANSNSSATAGLGYPFNTYKSNEGFNKHPSEESRKQTCDNNYVPLNIIGCNPPFICTNKIRVACECRPEDFNSPPTYPNIITNNKPNIIANPKPYDNNISDSPNNINVDNHRSDNSNTNANQAGKMDSYHTPNDLSNISPNNDTNDILRNKTTDIPNNDSNTIPNYNTNMSSDKVDNTKKSGDDSSDCRSICDCGCQSRNLINEPMEQSHSKTKIRPDKSTFNPCAKADSCLKKILRLDKSRSKGKIEKHKKSLESNDGLVAKTKSSGRISKKHKVSNTQVEEAKDDSLNKSTNRINNGKKNTPQKRDHGSGNDSETIPEAVKVLNCSSNEIYKPLNEKSECSSYDPNPATEAIQTEVTKSMTDNFSPTNREETIVSKETNTNEDPITHVVEEQPKSIKEEKPAVDEEYTIRIGRVPRKEEEYSVKLGRLQPAERDREFLVRIDPLETECICEPEPEPDIKRENLDLTIAECCKQLLKLIESRTQEKSLAMQNMSPLNDIKHNENNPRNHLDLMLEEISHTITVIKPESKLEDSKMNEDTNTINVGNEEQCTTQNLNVVKTKNIESIMKISSSEKAKELSQRGKSQPFEPLNKENEPKHYQVKQPAPPNADQGPGKQCTGQQHVFFGGCCTCGKFILMREESIHIDIIPCDSANNTIHPNPKENVDSSKNKSVFIVSLNTMNPFAVTKKIYKRTESTQKSYFQSFSGNSN